MIEDITKQQGFSTSGAGLESLIQPVQNPVKENVNLVIENPITSPSLSSIPVRIGSAVIGSGGKGKNLQLLADRTKQVSHYSSTLDISENGSGFDVYYYGSKDKDFITRILFTGEIKNASMSKKFLRLILNKAYEMGLSTGVIDPERIITVPIRLQELVDIGMYKSTWEAKRGILSAIDTLRKIEFQIEDEQHKLNSKDPNNEPYKGNIISGRAIDNGVVIIDLNPRANFGAINAFQTLLPRFVYALKIDAFDLYDSVSVFLRQHEKDLYKNGFVDISMSTIVKDLQLPEYEGNKNASTKVRGAIDKAVEEINKKQREYFGDPPVIKDEEGNEKQHEFLEYVLPSERNRSVKYFVEQGKLRIRPWGKYAAPFLENGKIKAEAEIRDRTKRVSAGRKKSEKTK